MRSNSKSSSGTNNQNLAHDKYAQQQQMNYYTNQNVPQQHNQMYQHYPEQQYHSQAQYQNLIQSQDGNFGANQQPQRSINYSNQNQNMPNQQQQNYYQNGKKINSSYQNQPGHQMFSRDEIQYSNQNSQSISQRSGRSENGLANDIQPRPDDSSRSQKHNSQIKMQKQNYNGKPPQLPQAPPQQPTQFQSSQKQQHEIAQQIQMQIHNVNINPSSGRSNTVYTQNSHTTGKSGRSAGASHKKKPKKSQKESGRLPPPRVEIQQPNFNNRDSGENSNSQSDYQDNHSESASKALSNHNGPIISGRMNSQNSARNPGLDERNHHQQSVMQANSDSYRNESMSIIYAGNQNMSQMEVQNSFNNFGHPQQQQQNVLQQPNQAIEQIQEESIDSTEARDRALMDEWGFAEGSVNQSRVEESPIQQKNVQVNNTVNQSSISQISSIRGDRPQQYRGGDMHQQSQDYQDYNINQNQVQNPNMGMPMNQNAPMDGNHPGNNYLPPQQINGPNDQEQLNGQPLSSEQFTEIRSMDPISRMMAEKSEYSASEGGKRNSRSSRQNSSSSNSDSGSYTGSGSGDDSDSGNLIFHDQADDHNNGNYSNMQDNKGQMHYNEIGNSGYGPQTSVYSGSRESHLLPIQFAKEHIIKIEEDMKKMHERHVRLMREMDENYKLIEKETQEYYIEFLGKWKEVAKQKIQQYRKNTESLALEKDKMQKEKDQQIDLLNEQRTQYLKEKEQLLKEHTENITNRDHELEQQKIEFEQNIKKKDNEIYTLKNQKQDMEINLTKIQVQCTSEVEQFKIQIQQLNKQQELQSNNDDKNLEQINSLRFQVQNLEQELKSSHEQASLQKRQETQTKEHHQKQIQDMQTQFEQQRHQIQLQQNKLMQRTNESLISGSVLDSQASSNVVQLDGANQDLAPGVDTSQISSNNVIRPRSTNPQGVKKINIKPIGQHPGNKLIKPIKINPLAVKRPVSIKPMGAPEPMSEAQFQKKKQDVQNCYNQKIEETKQMISHLEGRKKTESESFDGLEQIMNKLKDDLQNQTSKQEEELQKITNSYNQSQNKQKSLLIKKFKDPNDAQIPVRGASALSSGFNTVATNQMQIKQGNIKLNLANIKKIEAPNQNKRAGSHMQIVDNICQKEDEQSYNTTKPGDSSMVVQKVERQYGSLNSARGPANTSLIEGTTQYGTESRELQSLNKENQELKNKIYEMKSQIQNSQSNSLMSPDQDMAQQLLKQLEEQKKLSQIELQESKKKQDLKISELKETNKHAKLQLDKQKEQIRQLKEIITQNREQKARYKSKIAVADEVYEKIKKQMDELQQKQRHEEVVSVNQMKDMREKNERLWIKYQSETIQRKKLHNLVEDMKGKIRVYCRVRPMNQKELQMGCIDAIQIIDQFTLKIRVKKDQQLYRQSQSSQTAQSQYGEKEFNFDACFSSKTNQEEIFEDTKMLIQSAIDGFNVCIFAYGQTGSGKTYTMTGQSEHGSQGIVPRSFMEMFQLKQRLEKDNHFSIKFECYMVEIYLDKLYDLLTSGQRNTKYTSGMHKQDRLEIHEDPHTHMVFVQNAKVKTLNSFQEALDVFEMGLKSRKVNATDMNDQSSRSHLIYSVVVETVNNSSGQTTRGKISFVDLAGSERLNKSNSNANIERLKEATSINGSLTSLGDVIRSLSSGNVNKQHIPYRNNTLTHLMKDSLGGNSKTLMFVNISPADYNSQESQFSLQFGDRVKMIQNDVSKNVESEQMNKLKVENEKLKQRLGMIAQK